MLQACDGIRRRMSIPGNIDEIFEVKELLRKFRTMWMCSDVKTVVQSTVIYWVGIIR